MDSFGGKNRSRSLFQWFATNFHIFILALGYELDKYDEANHIILKKQDKRQGKPQKYSNYNINTF